VHTWFLGVDRAAQFGGTIEGNVAHALMEKYIAIIDEMVEAVLEAPTRVAGTDVGQMHRHLLLSLDGYFRGLRTKWFHLTPEILEKNTLVDF
jgi:hypothetical protein